MSILKRTIVSRPGTNWLALKVGAKVQEYLSTCDTLDEFMNAFNYELPKIKTGNHAKAENIYKVSKEGAQVQVWKCNAFGDWKVIYSIYQL